jgi:hypothetical protein
LKALKQICLLIVCGCFVLIGAGCGDSLQPSGKYISVIRLPGSGEEWTETIDFKPGGICITVIRQRSPSANGLVMETRSQSQAMEFS